MSNSSSESQDLLDRIQTFVGIGPSSIVTLEQLREFEKLLRESEEAQSLYLDLIDMLVCLPRAMAGTAASSHASDVEMDDCCTVPAGDDEWVRDSLSKNRHSPLAVDVSPIPAITPRYTSSDLFSGWPAAYLIATVLFGIAALIGTSIPIAQTRQPLLRATDHSLATAGNAVGQITNMIDCRWTGLQTVSREVVLGSTYELASGLMEITYNTGAKVVVHGPANYRVDSADGGFLALGKLTARVEKRGERRGERDGEEGSRFKVQGSREVAGGQWPVASDGEEGSRFKVQGSREVANGQWSVASDNHQSSINNQQSSNPQSLIPNPLFVIRTPTATITDLGTEFGVEVNEHGGTRSYVFQGLVEMQLLDRDGRPGRKVLLGANESASAQKSSADDAVRLSIGNVDPSVFVRNEQLADKTSGVTSRTLQRWQSYSERFRNYPAMVAYYTFEKAGATNMELPNCSAAGSALDGRIEGAEWVLGRFPEKYALYFHGCGSRDRVELPNPERFRLQDSYSVAVWFKMNRFTPDHAGLVTKGNSSWRLQRSSEGRELALHTNTAPGKVHRLNGTTAVDDNQWHLAVVVYESSGDTPRRRLFLDGRLEAEDAVSGAMLQTDDPVWIGANSGQPGQEFSGMIDEVAILSRALSSGEVAEMFDSGNPKPAK